jgi:hypothetical protein
MKIITCPEPIEVNQRSVFLAGGIVGCRDWQADVCAALQGETGVLLNPRRPQFPIDDPNAAPEQIEWEFNALRAASAISFWFAPETVQPIVMFEYGYWLSQNKPLIVGCHEQYPRRLDVEHQTRLVRPDIEIIYSLNELIHRIGDYLAR